MRSRYHSRLWVSCVLMCVLSAAAQTGAQVYLNEFLASNSTVLADAAGQYDDWIELYNAGASAVDIGGMFLTDDLDEPRQWQIPTDRSDLTTIPAGGYVLIWADDDTNDIELHASFKLSSNGEEIALVATDGLTLVDRIIFDEQRGNLSFGRTPDGGSNWGFMTIPTPGTANAEAYAGIVGDVRFSVEHGLFSEPFTVALTTDTPEAQIWYTLDTTKPHRNDEGQFEGMLYEQPIPVDGATVISAVAVKPEWKDSALACCTYIFFRDVQNQAYNASDEFFSLSGESNGQQDASDEPVDPNLEAAFQALPSVCLTIEPNDLFDPRTGIHANPLRQGIEWERPVSVEWIDPNDSVSFQVNAGVRIHGGISRMPIRQGRGPTKHSLRLLFKSQYGPARLDAPLFPDTDVTQFESLVLRCAFSESWSGMGQAQYVRDQFTRDTMRDMGRLTPHGRPVHVYINGFYWGLYILVERPDDGFAAAYLGGDKDEYDVLKPSSSGRLEIVGGDTEAWDTLFAMAEAGFEGQAEYELAQEYLDLPAMIDYMLMIFYTGSTDGPMGLNDRTPRNFWAIRPRLTAAGFTFLAWDLEFCLNKLDENRVTIVGTDNPHYLFHRLAAHPDFCMSVADGAYRHLFHDGALTPPQLTERYLRRADVIERAMLPEALRWSRDTEPAYIERQLADWYRIRDKVIETYFPARGDVVVEQLREAGFYPDLEAPRLEAGGREHYGGAVDMGTRLTLVNPNADGVVYYTMDGTDPRQFGQAASGVTAGQVAPSARRYAAPIDLTQSVCVKARVWDDGLWSPLAEAVFSVGPVQESLRVTEIMYHPPQADAEFIELANIGPEPLNLNFARLTGGIEFVFPSVELAPDEVILVVRDQGAFAARYGDGWDVAGQYGGALSNAADRIDVQDALGQTIQEIRYEDSWYPLTDGSGHSLICSDPWTTDPDTSSDPQSWSPSPQPGGSPGTLVDR